MAISIAEGKVRGFLVDRTSARPAHGAIAMLEAELDDDLWLTVGVLAADHAGYLSFATRALRSAGRSSVRAFRIRADGQVHPLSAGLDLSIAAPHFVLAVESPAYARRPAFASIQEPDDTDRDISPPSFATPPMTVIGDGDCDQLIPGGLAGFDYGVYRVVRVSQIPRGPDRPRDDSRVENLPSARTALPQVQGNGTVGMGSLAMLADSPSVAQLGVVLQFRQRWQPVGQSFGDLVYSLPLAPGESRDLAIIDWSRADTFARDDATNVSEKLLHHQSRDRTIEEAISAGLHERQEGWSFLAGTAGAASANIPIEAVNLSGSGDHALGVGIASSTGERNLAGFSQQDLADTVAQATSVVRSLRSTVIVQASQSEANVVQTRTVSNFNRCHALTIQYYEVLRNYRVVTELVRAAPAVLLPHDLVTFDEENALQWRAALARHLLNPSLAGCFDALAHLKRCKTSAYAAESATPSAAAPPAPDPRVLAASYQVRLDTGDRETWGAVWVSLITEDGRSWVIYAKDSVNNASGVAVPDVSKPELAALVLKRNSKRASTASTNDGGITGIGLDLRDVREVEVKWIESNGNDAWSFQGIGIDATDNSGASVPVPVNGQRSYTARPEIQRFDDSGATHLVWTASARIAARPAAPPATPAEAVPAQQKMTGRDLNADTCCAATLLGHLQDNQAYYSRVVWVGMDPTERRLRLLAAFGSQLVDLIDDRPLAVGGNQVAFRLNGAEALDAATLAGIVGEVEQHTQYVNVPARGVFAEAELGRCDACERRDVTRAEPFFGVRPPQIGDVTPGPRGSMPDLQPASLPAPVVQVVQAPAAPDPAGLAAAFGLLGRPDVFRDMSGMHEVRQLLDGLVSGAVSLTEAQILAKKAKDKQAAGSADGGGGAGTAAGGGGAGTASRSASTEPDAGRQIDRLDAIGQFKRDGVIDQGDARGAALGVLGGERSSGGYVQTAGGRAPAQKTGVGGAGGSSRKTSTGMTGAIGKLLSWGIDLGSAALASDEENLGKALSDAAVEIAEKEAAAAVDTVPFGKVLRLAVRYSTVFAEGAGVMIDAKRVDMQRLVDEAANFGNEMTDADNERLMQARTYLAIGWQQVPDVLSSGLDAVVEDLLDQATGLLGEAAASVATSVMSDIAAKLLKAVKVDRVYLAVANEVANNVPEARRKLYATLSKKLVRQLIATTAGTKAQRARLEGLVPTSSTEDPTVSVLRGLIDIAMGLPLTGVFAEDLPTDERMTLTQVVEFEAKKAAHDIVVELKAAGWSFVTHQGATGIVVDGTAKSIALPTAHAHELEFPPPLPAGMLGLLADDLATDEAALATVVDGLDAAILLRAANYQVDIDQAPGSGWTVKLEEAGWRTQEDAAEATAVLRDIVASLRRRYANTPVAAMANAALHSVVLSPATLRPPRDRWSTPMA